jgi:L-fuconolactonase
MTERIDSHHHLWSYKKEEYPWISAEMRMLARDFLLADLEKELEGTGIDGGIVVQARQSTEETEWLLSLARNSVRLRGIVGWAPICSAEFPAILERWRGESKLRGLRHIVQDEPDDRFLDREDFNRGIANLATSGLVYDILIFERHLPIATAFVDRHPNQVFVLDHIAKPRIGESILEPWAGNLREIARRESVYCKLSGMVTEAKWNAWTIENLRPYFDVALDAFGPGRLMVGSDWPVCLLASTYKQWVDTVHRFIQPLSISEKDLMLGRVASKVYSLEDSARTAIS